MNEPTSTVEPTDNRPAAMPIPVKRRSNGRWINALVALAVLVFVGGITFAIGRGTAPAQAAGPLAGQFPSGSFNPGGLPGGLFGGQGSRLITGKVASTNGSTMTLTTADGQTVTVVLSGTTYHSQSTATASDVTQGATVQVTAQGLGGPGGANGGNPQASPGTGTTGQTVTATDVTIVSK